MVEEEETVSNRKPQGLEEHVQQRLDAMTTATSGGCVLDCHDDSDDDEVQVVDGPGESARMVW